MVTQDTALATVSFYDKAIAALAEAISVDEVLDVRDSAERFRLYAKQAKNRDMIADAMEIQIRAERELGVMLIAAKDAGEFKRGGGHSRAGATSPDGTLKVRLADAGIDRKLSSRAQQMANAPLAQFAEMVERARTKIIAGGAIVVNPLKDLTTAEKKVKRADKVSELGRRVMALPDKRYCLIYADPEWQFEAYSPDTGGDRAADNHYPTSSLDAIKARDVPSIAADDCVLFLWATGPMLPQALDVMAAWGFTYKSQIVWRKLFRGDQTGTGYWFRSMHELLLVGTRGNIPAPEMGTQWGSVKPADVGAHSEKPDIFRQMIEQYFPDVPRIELNARHAVKGWDRWGYEADDAPALIRLGDEAQEPSRRQAAIDLLMAAALPFASTPESDAAIRAAYAGDALDLDALATTLGASKLQVRRRAHQLGLGSRDNQRAAVRISNTRRAQPQTVTGLTP